MDVHCDTNLRHCLQVLRTIPCIFALPDAGTAHVHSGMAGQRAPYLSGDVSLYHDGDESAYNREVRKV